MLDMVHINHKIKHENNFEYDRCRNTQSNTYVDDCFSTIESDQKNIWIDIEAYIRKMETYYTSNKLKINTEKTKILIMTKGGKSVDGQIVMNKEIVKNVRTIKVLGTIFNQNLNWHDNLLEGTNSLLKQIRRRATSIKRLRFYINMKFMKQLGNALLIGKLSYNLAVWGELGMKYMNIINNIMISTAKIISKPKNKHQTDNEILSNIGWIILTYSTQMQ